METKGWIALDIDGTITLDKHAIPTQVIAYLSSLASDGWNIAFATGRSYKFASVPLATMDFPYYFLLQNGSVVLHMPDRRIIEKAYLSLDDLHRASHLCKDIQAGPLAYAGFESGDLCFYRPDQFSSEDQPYFSELKHREGEVWQQISSFDTCGVNSFSLLKYFGSALKMGQVAKLLENQFHVTHIRDPFVPGIDLLLVTKPEVSKGLSLQRLFEKEGRGPKVIVAGDDKNDLSMFAVADFSIAMPHAPQELLERANLIAEPTSEFGIINALSKAIAHENN